MKVTEGVTEIWSKTLGANEFKVDIDEKIVPGKEYVFMVAALNGSTEGVYKGKKRRVPQPKHWWGHQADHTARYAKSVDIDNDIVYNAIESAVNEWNLELEGLNNHLIICASCIDSGTGKDKNADGRYVVIKTVNNENDSIGNAPSDRNKGCGKSVACVKAGENDSNSPGPGKHMGDMYLVLEEPPKSAYELEDRPGVWVKTNWQWTNKSHEHGTIVPCAKVTVPTTTCPEVWFMDVNSVLLHEFGHTLGLHDFYADKTMKHLNAVMNRSHTIEGEDKAQLRAIYRDHGRH